MSENGDKQEKPLPEPEEKQVQTQHTLTLDGVVIAYTATAGTILLHEEKEKEGPKPKAAVFYVAYTKDGVDDPATRPITFCFNGGPGSSSVWLHLGLFGPRRVDLGDEGHLPEPPYRLVDNAYSLLDETDLVFIDPVSTGYSRAVPGEEAKQFHDFARDIASVGEFIRLYTTRNGRWLSPKYLAGESYGTTRAGGLSGYLAEQHGLYLNGIMLISSILNFQTAYFHPGNDLPPILFLPTYAATAWYHGRLAPELQADLRVTLAEVEQFAIGDYAAALMLGSDLPEADQARIAARLARYTGLDPAIIERNNLRVNIHRFVKDLLRDQRRTVGRLDSRFTGIDRDAAGENHEYDPSYANIQGPYTAALNDTIRRDLKFESDLPYEILTGKVRPWSYERFQNAYVNVADTLRRALSINPHMRVLVANGYFDLATPYFATRYTFNHMDLDPSLRDNITMTYYEAGHMMYIHIPSLAQLKQDMVAFLRNAG